jgi:hypothetical protein
MKLCGSSLYATCSVVLMYLWLIEHALWMLWGCFRTGSALYGWLMFVCCYLVWCFKYWVLKYQCITSNLSVIATFYILRSIYDLNTRSYHYNSNCLCINNRNRNKYQISSWKLKPGQRVRLTASPPSVHRLSRPCGSFDVSQPYRSTRPVAGMALLFWELQKSFWLPYGPT